jgi:transcription antitermination factor NusG
MYHFHEGITRDLADGAQLLLLGVEFRCGKSIPGLLSLPCGRVVQTEGAIPAQTSTEPQAGAAKNHVVRTARVVMGMRVTEMVPQRYPEDRSLHEDLGLWQVLHVKSNWEKKVAAYLKGKNISYYMPLQKIRRTVGCFRSTRITEVPLFRGYVCFALQRDEHQFLYGSSMFVRILQVEDQERFVNELQAVGRAIETEDDIVLRPGLVPGKRAVILSGPLKGTEGVVVGSGPKRRLALSVQMFNQTVLVRLDPFTDVRPV